MKKNEVIIILGGGVDKQGAVSTTTKERLDGFLKKRNNLSGISILLSGRWSGLAKDAPKITEAQSMKEYLIMKRVNPKRIYLETKSLDTLSNAVFSREIMKKHKSWKNVLLATSDWHMKRALWIFKKVFGRQYHIYAFRRRKARKESCTRTIY